jgi:hypothetical protein
MEAGCKAIIGEPLAIRLFSSGINRHPAAAHALSSARWAAACHAQ